MKTKRLFLVVILVAAFAVSLPGAPRADMYLKYNHHTDAVTLMGSQQPAKEIVRETWIAKDMIRTDESDQTIILRLDKQLAYFVDHAKKVYSEAPLGLDKMAARAIEADEEMDEEEKERAKQFIEGMMGGMQMSVTVEKTGEKKKIGDWNCTRYLQTVSVLGTESVAEVWATKDIKVDYKLLNRMNAAGMMMMPGMSESMAEVAEEMSKIDGVTVYTVSTSSIMNSQVKSTQQLIEYSEKKAPEGFFDPPKGYTKQAM